MQSVSGSGNAHARFALTPPGFVPCLRNFTATCYEGTIKLLSKGKKQFAKLRKIAVAEWSWCDESRISFFQRLISIPIAMAVKLTESTSDLFPLHTASAIRAFGLNVRLD